jgi:hypothetical protein
MPTSTAPLDAVLRDIHNAWIEETRRFLTPALEVDADFWTRLAAIRYISDNFRRQYRLERALADELCGLIGPTVAARLVREGDRVFRLRLELDRIGRRRGTAGEFALGTAGLLEQLGVWCAEIELATRGISRGSPTDEGVRHLTHLEASLQTQR